MLMIYCHLFSIVGGHDPDLYRTIFVGGLPKVESQEEFGELNDFLWELFHDYGVDDIKFIQKKGFAFVKVFITIEVSFCYLQLK